MSTKPPRRPSAAQLSVVRWLAEDPERRVYGPMSGGTGNRYRFGYAGGRPDAAIRAATGSALIQDGLLRHVGDRYPLGYYALSDLGHAAAGEGPDRQAGPSEVRGADRGRAP